jgi:hypothetical protein
MVPGKGSEKAHDESERGVLILRIGVCGEALKAIIVMIR